MMQDIQPPEGWLDKQLGQERNSDGERVIILTRSTISRYR